MNWEKRIWQILVAILVLSVFAIIVLYVDQVTANSICSRCR